MSAANADTPTTGPLSPSDPSVTRAVLWGVNKYGLYPVAMVGLLMVVTWRLFWVVDARAASVDQRLEALSVTLAQHQAAMDRLEVERRAHDRAVLTLLRGICLANTDPNSQARAFCDAD